MGEDRQNHLRAEHVKLVVDGTAINNFSYNTTSDVVSWVPTEALEPGWHEVEVTARDPQGLERARVWNFRVTH